MAIKSRIINLFWNCLNKIPNLRYTLNRFYAWKIFDFVPQLKNLIYKLYDKYWYFELFINNQQFSLEKFQKNNYDINTDRIRFVIKNKEIFNHNDNWDLTDNFIDIEKTTIYKLVKNHFQKSIQWQEIEEYPVIIMKLSQNKEFNGISTIKEFDHLLEVLDTLYQNFITVNTSNLNQKIKVGIGRNGNYIILEGLLYFSLMKILNQDKVNITILKRHSKWVNFCNQILKFQYIHGSIYQPLIHPDLSLKSSYSDERFHVIKKNLEINHGTLLDIGSNLGFFCHKFEDIGFDCYAVEVRPSNVYFMKKLRNIEGKNFKIINQSIFELKSINFDIVLALNIFHHFLREKKLYIQFTEFLNKLQIKYMYFQPHNPQEKVMQNAYQNFNNQQFVDYILKHSCLNSYKIISENVEDRGRPLYLLTK